MKQDPADFRDRLPRALGTGLSRAEAARLFGVAERAIQALVTPPAGSPALAAQPLAAPDAMLAQHCDWSAAATGVRVGRSTMGRELVRLGLTLKKGA